MCYGVEKAISGAVAAANIDESDEGSCVACIMIVIGLGIFALGAFYLLYQLIF